MGRDESTGGGEVRAIQDIIAEENEKLEVEVDNLKSQLAEKDKRIKELEGLLTDFIIHNDDVEKFREPTQDYYNSIIEAKSMLGYG